MPYRLRSSLFFFFFNDTATTEIYTLSLHDALPILPLLESDTKRIDACDPVTNHTTLLNQWEWLREEDRKSTRLNSSHLVISYAVFCLKKKKTIHSHPHIHSGPYAQSEQVMALPQAD